MRTTMTINRHQVLPLKLDAPGCCPQKTHNRPHYGCFARAIASNQATHTASSNL
jgi:hypothetical protein